nr:MAG: hypothetical protein [Microvirus sp.]
MSPEKRDLYVRKYQEKRAGRVAVCPCPKCIAERNKGK